MGSSAGEKHFWDIHSHILPGLDDGSQDWDTTLKMMELSEKAGVMNIVATPHFEPWNKPADKGKIWALCQEASGRYKEKTGREIRMFPGNELYYHSDIISDIRAGRALTLNGSDTVLVEFTPATGCGTIMRGLADIRAAGYDVILAHVERYECLRKVADGLDQLLDAGILLQSNISEAGGGFFDVTTGWLKKLYKKEKIAFVASDMHGVEHRTPMTVEEQHKLLRFVSQEYLEVLLRWNAKRFLL
jgi:protein-tyrosine phosphatase